MIELKRENWCVKYLDINHDFSDNHLSNVIKDRPDLLEPLNKYNNNYLLLPSSLRNNSNLSLTLSLTI